MAVCGRGQSGALEHLLGVPLRLHDRSESDNQQGRDGGDEQRPVARWGSRSASKLERDGADVREMNPKASFKDARESRIEGDHKSGLFVPATAG